MSIPEEAEKLRAIGSSDDYVPVNFLIEAKARGAHLLPAIQSILGDNPRALNIEGANQFAATAIDSAIAALHAVQDAVYEAADYHARG